MLCWTFLKEFLQLDGLKTSFRAPKLLSLFYQWFRRRKNKMLIYFYIHVHNFICFEGKSTNSLVTKCAWQKLVLHKNFNTILWIPCNLGSGWSFHLHSIYSWVRLCEIPQSLVTKYDWYEIYCNSSWMLFSEQIGFGFRMKI